jgi:hypothetical protein
MEVVKSKKSSGKHKQRVAEPEGQIPAAPTLDELLKSPGNNETTEEQLIESEIPGFLTIMLLKISTSMDMHVVRDHIIVEDLIQSIFSICI